MGKVSTFLVAILLLSSQTATASYHSGNVAITASEPYDFVLAVIESFEKIEIAKERIENSDDPSLIIFVKDMIVFNSEMERARSFIKPHLSSKNESIKKSANGFDLIYSLIIGNNEKLLNFYEKVFNEKDNFSAKEGTFTKKMGEMMATNEDAWRLLPKATVEATFLLIDPKRTIDGKLKYLKINSKERRQLINKLESVFGDKVKGGPKIGQLPVEISEATLWKVLNDPWKSSDSD